MQDGASDQRPKTYFPPCYHRHPFHPSVTFPFSLGDKPDTCTSQERGTAALLIFLNRKAGRAGPPEISYAVARITVPRPQECRALS